MSLLPTPNLQYIDRLMREKPGFYRDVPRKRNRYCKRRDKDRRDPGNNARSVKAWRAKGEPETDPRVHD